MKQHIYYSSTAYQNIYSENKNSSFRSDIVAHNLDYIADGQLEAALVNLTFTLKEKILNKNLQLGVRSSLQLDANIRASNYDNIIYTFTLLASLKTSLNYQVPPTQYIYFSTTKEHLSRAKFEIINLETNELFGEIDNSSSPTLKSEEALTAAVEYCANLPRVSFENVKTSDFLNYLHRYHTW